jgi:hypothetical protein
MRSKSSSSRLKMVPKRRARKGHDCIAEETLELYVLERLPGQRCGTIDDPELEAVEIHLLICEECQVSAVALEAETRQLRSILRLAEPAKPKTFTAGR